MGTDRDFYRRESKPKEIEMAISAISVNSVAILTGKLSGRLDETFTRI